MQGEGKNYRKSD